MTGSVEAVVKLVGTVDVLELLTVVMLIGQMVLCEHCLSMVSIVREHVSGIVMFSAYSRMGVDGAITMEYQWIIDCCNCSSKMLKHADKLL